MSWSTDFPDFGALPQPILDAVARREIIDISYGNDACPCFIRSSDDARLNEVGWASGHMPLLWVDFEDPEERETDWEKRCTVVGADYSEIVNTDDAAEALRVLMAQPQVEGGAA